MDRSSSCFEQVAEMGRSNFSSEDIRHANCSSELSMPAQPRLERMVANLNVSKSSHVYIGARYVSITQNIGPTEVVNDLPFYRYVCHIAKTTTKVERVICAAALFILILCIVVVIYFTIKVNNVKEDIINIEPQKWFIRRKVWLARKYNITEKLDDHVPLVIIGHTVSPACYTFIDCVAALKNIQSYFLENYDYDIPYNFLIGNDGRVYEGLGWNIVGAHTLGYNRCSVGVAFVGDYRVGLPSYSNVTELQLQRAHMLLKEGVKHGYLHTHFRVLGAKDLRPTLSPGANLYKAIQGWSHYDHKNVFKDHTCDQILKLFVKENVISDTNMSANISLISYSAFLYFNVLTRY